MRFENGVMLNMDDIITEHLNDEAHVWVMLKEDMALIDSETPTGTPFMAK